jgi:hypothetical protein
VIKRIRDSGKKRHGVRGAALGAFLAALQGNAERDYARKRRWRVARIHQRRKADTDFRHRSRAPHRKRRRRLHHSKDRALHDPFQTPDPNTAVLSGTYATDSTHIRNSAGQSVKAVVSTSALGMKNIRFSSSPKCRRNAVHWLVCPQLANDHRGQEREDQSKSVILNP